MNSPTLHDNIKEYSASWKWITEQLERREKNLEQYEQNPNAKPEYIRREKAFNASLKKFIHEVSHRLEYAFKQREKENKESHAEIINLKYKLSVYEAIIELHGLVHYHLISPQVIINNHLSHLESLKIEKEFNQKYADIINLIDGKR